MSSASAAIDTYRPFPRQQEFHACPAKYRVFGGAAGPGKTTTLLWEGIMQALENDGVDTLLLRRTFPELEVSLLSEFRRNVPWRQMGATFNESKHIVTWPNGSTTRFGYCKNENDVYQYQGGEYLFIGFDELTHFTLSQWQYLTSRNRCRLPGSFPCMAGATNPGNIGHKWVKALFVDHIVAPGMDRPEEYDPRDYEFIPATLDDNPIYAKNESYLKTLDSLPQALYLALRKGIWDIPAGQFFDCWNANRNTVHSSEVDLKPWFPRWISGDWGNVHPSAFYWHAKDGDTVYTYRELYGDHLGEEKLGKRIAELCAEDVDANKKPIPIKYVFLSPDAFAERTSERTIAEQIGAELSKAGIPRPCQADDDRVGGARLMYQLLQSGYWKIFKDTCPNLVECIPTLLHDPKKLEDVRKVDRTSVDEETGMLKPTGSIGDDPYDGARYGLKSMLSPGKMPIAERVEQRVTAAKITDPTSQAIFAQKFALEERKKDAPVFLGGRRGRKRWWQ